MAFLGVVLGAFGTHSLRGKVPDSDLAIWGTAVQYHTIHAVALVLIGVIAGIQPTNLVRRSGWFIFAGTLIFSGSLYLLVLTNTRWLGAVTPVGGLCLLAGWLNLAVGAGKRDK